MISQALQDTTQRIKESINLVDFIERDGVALKKSGKWYIGMCPFHANNNTQAFGVTVDGWKCFAGCGAGDVFSYIMKRENCDFTTAKEKLTNGVTLTAMPLNTPQPSKVTETKPQRIFSPIPTKSANLSQWQAYAPLLTGELIRGHGLTVGKLPHSACNHERLLVPLTVNGKTLAIRGRSLGCDHVKWLQGAGGAHVIYNGAVLLNKFVGGEYDHLVANTKSRLLLGDTVFTAHGAIHTVVIVENLIDSILLQAKLPTGYGVVATGGINPNGAIWHNLATACKVANVGRVIVAFDRPNERNAKETNGAWVTARDGLKPSGAEVVRFQWRGGQFKDFGEWLKLLAMCHHNLWQWDNNDTPYCPTCGAKFNEWSHDQQVNFLSEGRNGH